MSWSDGTDLSSRTHARLEPGEGGPGDRLVRLTARLCAVLRDANRHSWFAPAVREQVEELHADLVATARAQDGLRLEFEENGVQLDDARFEDPPRAVRQLAQMVRRKGLRALRFGADVTAYEIVVLCQVLQSRTSRIEARDREQLQHIDLEFDAVDEGPRPRPTRPPVGRHDDPAPQVLRRSRLGQAVPEHDGADGDVRDLIASITSAIDGISHDPGLRDPRPAVPPSGAPRSGLLDLVDQLGHNAEIALVLSSLRRHDEYTYDHSINVGLLSICLARHLGWKGRDLQEFGIAALIHDVGKLYTPLEILNKPGRLTPQEWIAMKKHPRDGYDILTEGGVGSAIAPAIAIEHHTAPDGTGYPPLPYGPERMHPGSQIVKIADVYDAFTTIRPYRSQARPQEVLKMLRKQAGTHFEAEFVEAFCEMMGEYPIGSTLRLASGRIALVVDVDATRPTQPIVRLLRDADGRRVRGLQLVDLRVEDGGVAVDRVEEIIDPVIRNIPIGRYI